MDRSEQLKFCRVCAYQEKSLKQGIICSLTGLPAKFVGLCDSFKEDSHLRQEALSKAGASKQMDNVADGGKRLANFLLDLIFLNIFGYIFGIALGIFLAIFSPSTIKVFQNPSSAIELLFGAIVALIYFTILEGANGRTIAKYITKTKVVDENGKKPNLDTIFVRSISRLIPFEPFSFLGSENSGWHDKFSNTKVVRIQ